MQTILKETPLHVALRLQNIEAVKLLLESSSLDVVCCDTFQRVKVSIHHYYYYYYYYYCCCCCCCYTNDNSAKKLYMSK